MENNVNRLWKPPCLQASLTQQDTPPSTKTLTRQHHLGHQECEEVGCINWSAHTGP